MSTPYSRRPDWVAATRDFLISVRRRPDAKLPGYGEVAAVYGGNGEVCDPADPRGRRAWQDELARIRSYDWTKTVGGRF